MSICQGIRHNILLLFGNRKQKAKMCLALQSVEKDLNALSQMQKKISGVSNYVHKTPLGILLPRKAGTILLIQLL